FGARNFQESRRDHLIRVDIVTPQRDSDTVELAERLHHALPASIGRTSARCPVTAAAATIAGDIRWVRAPGPWRPRKLRLVVEAQRSPGATMSPLIPMHIEQPLSPQVRPASVKILSSPSCSA